jgi:hypothetical protein
MNQQSIIALKIRFILLGDTIVMLVLEQNSEAMGVKDGRFQFRWISNGITIKIQDIENAVLEEDGILLSYKQKTPSLPCLPAVRNGHPSFEQIKLALTEFAQNNAFHLNDNVKPPFRIEAEDGGSRLYYPGGKSALFALVSPKQLRDFFDIPGFVVCENKPMFSHEWKRLVPPIYTIEDFDTSGLSFNDDKYSNGFEDAISKINESGTSFDIEVWEFTMSRIFSSKYFQIVNNT